MRQGYEVYEIAASLIRRREIQTSFVPRAPGTPFRLYGRTRRKDAGRLYLFKGK